MSLTELIAAVGQEHIEVQFLHESMVRANHNVKKASTITFATAPQKVLDLMRTEKKFVGVILWFPAERMPKE